MSDRPLGRQVGLNTQVGFREVQPFSNNPVDQSVRSLTIRTDGKEVKIEPRDHQEIGRLMLEKNARLGHRVEGMVKDRFRGFLIERIASAR